MSDETKSPAPEVLRAVGVEPAAVKLVADTDISLDGRTERQWIAVTESSTSVVVGGQKPVLLREVRWGDVQEFRTIAGVGSGLLQAKLDDEWVDLLRFSNVFAHRFHKISRRLDLWAEQLREREKAPADGAKIGKLERSFDDVIADDEPLDLPKCPTCFLRLPKNAESCPRCLQKGKILKRVADLLAPHWKGALLLVVLTILGVGAELIPPKLQQYMVDHLLTGKGVDDVDVPTALLMVVMALATSRVMLSIVGVIKGRVSSVIGSGLTCSLRLQMVQKLQQMAVSYYDRHHVGSMISRVAHDSEVLHGLMHQLTGGFLLQIVKLFGVGAMLFWINPKLAAYTLIPVPLVFVGSWVFWQKVYPRYFRLRDASSKQMSVLNGMLSGIRVVKSFAQEDREYNRFQSSAENLRNWRLWVEYANARYSAAMQLVFSLGGLIVWYVGGRDVVGTQMTLGELIAFLAYLSMFYAPLGALSNFTTWLTSFLSGSKRVLELLDTPLSIMEPENPADWTDKHGAIEFDRVTFGYDRNQPVLKDISFRVAPGEMVGIVGRSGSGKTTMVNLLSRFYDPQEGTVTIDDIDVRNLSVKELRENLGIVFQDSFLFRGTIFNNLAYGRPKTLVEETLAAAKSAGAHDFICNKQLGYETQLGQRGSGLSGGEKQRLSIARTLLYDPRILVLDEATSNIDAEAEKSIQEALEVLTKGRTTVAIAHRLSTLRNADRILVFDRGRLIEQGSHAELLSKDGTYARLVRIQTQVSKDPNVDKLLFHSEDGNTSANHSCISSTDSGSRTLASGSSGEANPREENAVAVLEPETNDANGDEPDEPRNEIYWLEPVSDEFSVQDEQLCLQRSRDESPQNVFLIRTFPASRPHEYLSVRHWDSNGDDIELGILRNVDDWPEETQLALKEGISRRYLLPEIRGVHSAKLNAGFLELDVTTASGHQQKITMRWTASKAIEFGDNGKLILDTNDNRYLVRDVEALEPRDRERFLQYIYW